MRHDIRLRHALVAGWVVPAVGGWGATQWLGGHAVAGGPRSGWGATQWLGEPVATEGPSPYRPPASGAERGPRPEHACDDHAVATAMPAPRPTASAAPLLVVRARTH
ncbi:hypothetical protein ACWEQP_27725 [Streptomyces sp. NPDC004044]